jgi:hypothetical protein
MTEQKQASPRPWKHILVKIGRCDCNTMQDRNGDPVLGTAENVPLIVRAVNAYDKMREALEAIIAECPNPKLPYGNAIVGIARAALEE